MPTYKKHIMNSLLQENIKFIRKRGLGLTQATFAKTLGVTRSAIGSYEEGRAEPKLEIIIKIAALYKISTDQLLTQALSTLTNEHGIFTPNSHSFNNAAPSAASNNIISGRELKVRELIVPTDAAGNELVSLVPEKAKAGYLAGYADAAYLKDLPNIKLPFLPHEGTFRAFQIEGDSMPPLPSGSIVIGEFIENWYDIKDKRTYVVVSNREGLVYKRVINQIETDQKIRCRSDNPRYDDFDIAISDVQEVWRAKAFIINSEDDGLCCFFTKYC